MTGIRTNRRIRWWFLAAMLCASQVFATPRIVVLNGTPTVGWKAEKLGLVGLFGSTYADSQLRKSGARVGAALDSVHSGFDPIAEIRNSFQCRPEGAAEPSALCTETELLELANPEKEDEAIATIMKQRAWTRSVVIKFAFYFFKNEDFMVRALVKSFENGQEIRGLQDAVVYIRELPQSARDAAKRSTSSSGDRSQRILDQYWLAGSPTRLEQSIREAVHELAQAVSWLDNNALFDQRDSVRVRDYPQFKAASDLHNPKCGRFTCSSGRVLRTTDVAVWAALMGTPSNFVVFPTVPFAADQLPVEGVRTP